MMKNKIFFAFIASMITFFVYAKEDIVALERGAEDLLLNNMEERYVIDRDIDLIFYNKGAYTAILHVVYSDPNNKLVRINLNNILSLQKRTVKIPKGSSYITATWSLVTIDDCPYIRLKIEIISSSFINNKLIDSIGSPNKVIFHTSGSIWNPQWKLVG